MQQDEPGKPGLIRSAIVGVLYAYFVAILAIAAPFILKHCS